MILAPEFLSFHKAFSPSIIKATKEGIEASAKIQIAKGHYTVFPSTGYIEIDREYFNSQTNFNLSKILSGFFNDTFTAQGSVYADERFAVPYTIKNTVSGALTLYTALNGVSQIGESSNVANGVFVTGFERLKKYEGYELNVAVTNYGNITNVYGDDAFPIQLNVDLPHFIVPVWGYDTSEVSIRTPDTYSYLTDFDGNFITDYFGNKISVYSLQGGELEPVVMYVDEVCTPKNPFYVRWINNSGGIDYWMFGNRQIETIKNSDIKTFKPYIENTQTASATDVVVSMEGSKSIKAGAQGLTPNEYDNITKLIFSPRVEWYNEAVSRWITLIPTSTFERDTNSTRNSLDIDFLLPRLLTQF
jgi:hypothetical protein